MLFFFCQGEQATKGHEVISLRNEARELRLEVEQKNKDIATLRIAADNAKKYKTEVEELTIQLDETKSKLELVSENKRKCTILSYNLFVNTGIYLKCDSMSIRPVL